jgi:hypothetical protein
MNPLTKVAVPSNVAEARDTVGGSFLLETGIHDLKIDTAYFGESAGGATSVNITFKGNGNTLRQTFWVTSGKAKGQKTTYKDRNGTEHFLPGYTAVDDIGLLSVGKGITELDTEEKMVNVFDFSLRKEVPTKVLMIMDLLNQDITLGVIKQTVDKNIKNGEGKYVPSGETRDENEVDKVFRTSDRMTTVELKAQVAVASFIDTWKERWDGKTRNRSVGVKASGATLGAPTGTKSGMFDRS